METLSLLGDGFITALSWDNLIWVVFGTVMGTLVGALPGLDLPPVWPSCCRSPSPSTRPRR